MQWSRWGVVLSVVLHGGAAAAVIALPKSVIHKSTFIAVSEAKKAKAKADADKAEPPKPPEPPKPVREPTRARVPKAVPPPDNTPPPPATPAAALPPSPVFNALPDLGLSMSNVGGPGGIAVGPSAKDSSAESAPRPKVLEPAKAAAPRASREADDGCAEPEVKPKPLGAVQPAYTDAARSASVEGKVRLRLSVDASGDVVDATVVSGLGYGLDEAAVSAAKKMKFTPASRCGRALASTFVIATRFALGE
jgi:periplasmic protein TonB